MHSARPAARSSEGIRREGGELAVALTVNGLADSGHVIEKRGLRVGDALILTKALGTGALFAAHNRGKAKGRWVEGAVGQALQSSSAAARCLSDHDAAAMTDVTGFGLIGHLGEMLDASGVGARLALSAVPFLPGAREVVGEGIVSSLQAENLERAREVEVVSGNRQSEAFELLFDPQTAGGLLAGVPAGDAADALRALKAAGYEDAAIIGETCERNAAGPSIMID